MTGQHVSEVTGHAFVSYVREDERRVDRLVRILEAAGIKVWRDTADIRPGQDWQEAIRDAIKTGSLAFIACFSENSQQRKKTYQNEELILAAEEMRQHQYGVTWLIPVRFADCDLPPIDLGNGRTLRSLHHVDLFGESSELGAVRLITAVLNVLHAPVPAVTETPAEESGSRTGTRADEQLAEHMARAKRAEREADELRRQLRNARNPGRPDMSATPFWHFLSPAEREIMRSVAVVRTLAKGATIMEQGESADYVVVILGGTASIRVNEHGREREVARRSEGQLIGESAALRLSVRSADVVALEEITALVVKTRDFANFLSGRPHILEFVQEQRNARGTKEPDEGDPEDLADSDSRPGEPDEGDAEVLADSNSRADSGGRTTPGLPGYVPTGQPQSFKGENCTVVLTDVVAFGSHKRTDTDRSTIRVALYSMMQTAIQGFAGARLEDRGDGILVVIPPNVSTERVMGQLRHVLPEALDRHNRDHRNPAQFQLRLAVDVGPVKSDGLGVIGEAIIAAARMVEASAFKEAFTGSTARLGIIVSPFVFDSVVRHDPDFNYVAGYSALSVDVKEFHAPAWMMFIG